MDHTNDIVNRTMIDRNPGISIFRKQDGKLLHGNGIRRRHNIHPRSEDIFHLHVVKLNGCPNQLTFMVLQPTFVFCLFHHGNQFLLCNAFLF